MGISKGEKKPEEILEILITDKFLKLMLGTKPQIQEALRVQSRINTKNPTQRHIIFKLQKIKDKEKNLK